MVSLFDDLTSCLFCALQPVAMRSARIAVMILFIVLQCF